MVKKFLTLSLVAMISFTKMSAQVNLNVPFKAQVDPGDWNRTANCGPTCVLMVQGFYRNTTPSVQSIRDIDDWMYNNWGRPINNYNGSATTKNDLLNLAKTYCGYYSSFAANYTSATAKSEAIAKLNSGLPLIVAVRIGMTTTSGGHFMVIRGYDNNNVYVNDPGRSESSGQGRNKAYSWATFLASWATQNYATVVVIASLPTPTITSPTADATMQNLPLRATWGAITGADAYRVQVSKSLSGWTAQGGWLSVTSPPTPSVPVNSNTSSPSLSAALEAGTVYYISVRCNIPGRGVSNYSTPIKFTTRVAAPVLLTPANNATAVMAPVNLVANNVSGADSYRHQISTSLANWTAENGFTTSTSPSSTVPVNVSVQNSSPNFSWSGTTSGVFSAPQSNVTYYWTMRVNVPGKGWSQYCTPRKFTVAILPSLNISPMSFSNLPATASTQNLLITSTGGFASITSAPNWVTPSQTNSIGIGTIRLSVAANPNSTARSGLIVVRLNGIERSIPISQVAGYLTPSITALSNLPNTALTRSVSVSASALFTATSNVTWATVRVNGNTLTINVLANRDPSLRSGTITIRQGNITKVIAISQAKRSNLVADGNNNANAAMQQQNGVREAAQEKEVAIKEVDTKPSMSLGEEATTTKKSQIYPNPIQVGDNLTLKFQSELDKEVLFEIIDLEGKVVLTFKQVCFKGENLIQLNTNALSNGLHFIRNSLNKEVLKFEVIK